MADLVQWLKECLNEDERIARAATPGPWRAHDTHLGQYGYAATVLSGDGNDTDLRAWLPSMSNEPWDEKRNVWADAAHIAAHDPARVLREIEAKRQLLADVLAEGHFRNEEDNWYSCAALTDEDGDPVCLDESRAPGPCDCGRDARVARRVRLLALPFEDRPGFAEAIASAE